MSKEQELKEMLKLYSKQDLWNRIQEKQAMIYDLETKLAEKDKEIKYYESEWKSCQINLDHYKGECLNLQDEQNQKSIEQLEKAKETINDKYQYLSKLEQQGELTFYGEGAQNLCYLLLKQIDQQINELKGEVEE